ncbi:MAG: nuclear transport factor 2 family protein [Gemmatimonadetes bacterium]|nr:nuclear transport factor 2 family protein [Gemmatimonadota bacterium]
MNRSSTLLVALAALTACNSAETPQQAEARIEQESAAFQTAIKGIESRWEGFYAAGQPDSIANLFTEDGRDMPPNGPIHIGRAAIAADQASQAKAFDTKVAITSEGAWANGPIGIDRGTYGFEGKVKKGAPKGTPASIADHGTYLAHWHNVNGTWQVAALAYTSSWTATPPKPAPVKKAPAKKPTTRRR